MKKNKDWDRVVLIELLNHSLPKPTARRQLLVAKLIVIMFVLPNKPYRIYEISMWVCKVGQAHLGTPLRAFRNQFTGHTVMYTGHKTQQKLYTSLRVINSRRWAETLKRLLGCERTSEEQWNQTKPHCTLGSRGVAPCGCLWTTET